MNIGRFTQKEVEMILDSLKLYIQSQSDNRDEAYNDGAKEISEHYQQKALDAVNLYYDIRSYCKKEFSFDEFAMTERKALRKIARLIICEREEFAKVLDNKVVSLDEYLGIKQPMDSRYIGYIRDVIHKYEKDNKCSLC